MFVRILPKFPHNRKELTVLRSHIFSGFHPSAVGKVGDGNGHGAHGDRLFRQNRNTHPGSHIIDIDRRIGLVFDTVEKGAVDQIIHPAVASPDPVMDKGIPHGMLVFFQHAVGVAPLFAPVKALFLGILLIDKEGLVIFHKHGFGTLYDQASGVKTGQSRIQSQRDRLTVSAGDHRRDHIPLGETGPGLIVRFPFAAEKIGVESLGAGRRTGQFQHTIPVIDPQHLGDGAQLMGRIVFGVAVFVVP